MTVKQYVLLCTASTLLPFTDERKRQGKPNAYKAAGYPIGHIVCGDGTEISVQAHCYVHTLFADVKDESPSMRFYASNIGKQLLMCETDSDELDQYGIDDIEDIQKVVDSHGGIDIDATIDHLIDIVK